MAFKEQLKKARQGKGLTQKQVADALGVSKQTITAYEAGTREPDLLKLVKLSEALDTTPDELLETNKAPTPQVEEQGPTEEQLNQILIALPVVVKRQVVSLVDAILGPPIQLSETSTARMAKLAAELENQHVGDRSADLEAQVD